MLTFVSFDSRAGFHVEGFVQEDMGHALIIQITAKSKRLKTQRNSNILLWPKHDMLHLETLSA